MKWGNILVLLFLFFMIGISIYFSSSPFSIYQSYSCINITTYENKTANLCGKTSLSSELTYVQEIVKAKSILNIQNNLTECSYENTAICIGDINKLNGMNGSRFAVKQVYSKDLNECKPEIGLYFTDCFADNSICVSGRCVKYKYEVNINNLMEGIGFKQ